MNHIKHKVVLLGETAVGKTSLLTRLLNNRFTNLTESTIGGAFSTKQIELDNNNKIILNIWDTAGQERYRSLTSFFYRGASGCLCVFDITDRDSFKMIPTWIKLFKEGNEGHKYIIIIVGNKCDVDEDKWQITQKSVKEFADDNNCLYTFTSCLTGENIHETFHILAEKMAELDNDKNSEIIPIDSDNDDNNNNNDIDLKAPKQSNFCWC